MPIQKDIPKVKTASLAIPDPLQMRKEFYEEAGYKYTFGPKELNYIKYNTLRNKRKNFELVDVIKIYRLQDRESGQEHLVYYQQSKVMDFNNNLVPCPVPECFGVVDVPKTNIIKNELDEVTDIALVETQNYYPEEFEYSKEKVIELFNKSRSSANIACYVGFTKNPRVSVNDFIENKKLILDQEAFINRDFDTLMTLPDNINMKKTWKNNKENVLRKLKVKNSMKNVKYEGIEKRVKDNGQLWEDDTEVISKQQKEEELKLKGVEQNGEENNQEEQQKSEQGQKDSDNNQQEANKEQQKLRVSRA